MDKQIVIDGKTTTLRATALVPKLYRHLIGRDIVADMAKLRKAYSAAEAARKAGASEEEQADSSLSAMDLEIFENVAWVMLKHAAEYRDVEVGEGDAKETVRQLWNGDMYVGKSPDDWLEHLDGIFPVYTVLPDILALWEINSKPTVQPGKK